MQTSTPYRRLGQADRRHGIAGRARYVGGVVFDGDCRSGRGDTDGEGMKIEPAVRRIFQAAVIQIETVDINSDFHKREV